MIKAPSASPAINVETTMLVAYTVLPRVSFKSRTQITSSISEHIPEVKYIIISQLMLARLLNVMAVLFELGSASKLRGEIIVIRCTPIVIKHIFQKKGRPCAPPHKAARNQSTQGLF